MTGNSDELRILVSDLKVAPKTARKLVSAHVRKSALLLVRDAKQRAPVDTGNLRRSIGTEPDGPFRAEVGPLAHYGAHVEYGTWKQKAQPYMMPAANVVEPHFVKGLNAIAETIQGNLT